MVLYRAPRTEIKHVTNTITYVGATSQAIYINNPVQGPGVNERIGNKIKVLYIEAVIACTASTPIRLDLVLPNDATSAFTPVFDGPLDRRIMSVMKTQFLTNGTSVAASGAVIGHKLPYGLNVRYTDGTAGSINKGTILAGLSTPSAQTITGYFRVWYTDT